MARALVLAVVGMGVAILAAVAFLGATIAGRVAHRPPAVAGAPVTAQAFVAPPIEVPKGAHVEALSTGADRLVLEIALADGSRQLVILDLATGRRLGTIPLTAP